jgi:hypothetical protein
MFYDFAQLWLLHHDNTLSHISFFTTELFTKNNMAVIPHPSYLPDLAPHDFSTFPQLEIKLKVCHFDTTEVIEAESEAVLNEHPHRI